jgi:hypothetical protein
MHDMGKKETPSKSKQTEGKIQQDFPIGLPEENHHPSCSRGDDKTKLA